MFQFDVCDYHLVKKLCNTMRKYLLVPFSGHHMNCHQYCCHLKMSYQLDVD